MFAADFKGLAQGNRGLFDLVRWQVPTQIIPGKPKLGVGREAGMSQIERSGIQVGAKEAKFLPILRGEGEGLLKAKAGSGGGSSGRWYGTAPERR
jgi:hypothetical protein